MNFNELYQLLKTTEIPLKKKKSSTKLPLPFMILSIDNDILRGSDDKILIEEYYPQIELYTEVKDEKSAEILENLLIKNNLPFEASEETLIADEGVYVKYYDLQKITRRI